METKTLNIEGMSCGACVRAVTNALLELEGVQGAEVSLEGRRAIVTFDPDQVPVSTMTAAIAEEGYAASPAE